MKRSLYVGLSQSMNEKDRLMHKGKNREVRGSLKERKRRLEKLGIGESVQF